LVEWYDPVATLVRKYVLSYFDFDDTIEMVSLSVIFVNVNCISICNWRLLYAEKRELVIIA